MKRRPIRKPVKPRRRYAPRKPRGLIFAHGARGYYFQPRFSPWGQYEERQQYLPRFWRIPGQGRRYAKRYPPLPYGLAMAIEKECPF